MRPADVMLPSNLGTEQRDGQNKYENSCLDDPNRFQPPNAVEQDGFFNGKHVICEEI